METISEFERIDDINENLKLICRKKGLTFGTDAYLIAAYARKAKRSVAVDLGSGTGIIALLCAAKDKFGKIFAIEIQPEFSDLIRRNAILNGLSDKILPICADVREIKPNSTDGEVDVVISNPPYMKVNTGKRNDADEKYIARHEVCGSIYDFCSAAARLLRYGGSFYCVYRPDRLTELLDAMRKNTLEPKRMTFVHADSMTPPSIVLIEAKKGSACGLKLTPPLLLYNETINDNSSRTMTDAAMKIYENCSFDTFGIKERT